MIKKWVLRIGGGLLGLLVLIIAVTAVRNRSLPTHSSVVDYLSDLEKARLAELFHLRATLGDEVWPGWGAAEIPVIVHNEAYAFLVGYPGETPPPGWVKVPHEEHRGGPWEIVPEDTFQGQPYYRQPISSPDKTPENFTVLVGERWVATLQTKEYAAVVFYNEFREELPGFLRPIFPYRLMWGMLIDSTETYVGGLAHETFHAYQGLEAKSRLYAAEQAMAFENRYPWENDVLEQRWQEELSLLHQAVEASSEAEARDLAEQFLAQRAARRAMEVENEGMTTQGIDFERQREWLEGLAKYAELSIGLEAARTPSYEPVTFLEADPAFKHYNTRERYWSRQVGEIQRMQNRSGDVRFYYSGMAQAVLLDRLMPGWKAHVWDEDVWLEDLLAEAVGEGSQR
ncbi:MAG: hypothetical protein GVY30_04945 [Chloroflexi bacterium]|jgi:hypothetical protein|nr:hypothetical protein [Chloroflexota bacterium]